MAGLVYFIPGQSENVSLETLRSMGLGYAFERQPDTRGTTRGVEADPRAGVLLRSPGTVPDARFSLGPDQRWERVVGVEAFVGYYPVDRPTPADLERARLLAGHGVELGDGQSWLVPVARSCQEQGDGLVYAPALPHRLKFGPDGHWQRDGMSDAHARLWDHATRWWDALQGIDAGDAGDSDRVMLDMDDAAAGAVDALAANYRLGPTEVSMLGLFDETAVGRVLYALVDWPTIQAWLKKKAQRRLAG